MMKLYIYDIKRKIIEIMNILTLLFYFSNQGLKFCAFHFCQSGIFSFNLLYCLSSAPITVSSYSFSNSVTIPLYLLPYPPILFLFIRLLRDWLGCLLSLFLHSSNISANKTKMMQPPLPCFFFYLNLKM